MIKLYIYLLILSILALGVFAWKERKELIKFSNLFICFVFIVFAFYSITSIQRTPKEEKDTESNTVVIRKITILNMDGDTITVY